MRDRNLLLGGLIILSATLVYTALLYGRLPAQMATHWGLDGRPDQWSGREVGAMIGPIIQACLLLVFATLPHLSPERAKIDSFAGAYNAVCLYVLGFLALLHVLVIQAALGPIEMTKWLGCGMFVLFILVGNLITKAKRNYWMGIRTPWTLESEEVWDKTHRLGGRLMVAGSIVGLVGTLMGAPLAAMVLVILLVCLVPVVYSYLLYRHVRPGVL